MNVYRASDDKLVPALLGAVEVAGAAKARPAGPPTDPDSTIAREAGCEFGTSSRDPGRRVRRTARWPTGHEV